MSAEFTDLSELVGVSSGYRQIKRVLERRQHNLSKYLIQSIEERQAGNIRIAYDLCRELEGRANEEKNEMSHGMGKKLTRWVTDGGLPHIEGGKWCKIYRKMCSDSDEGVGSWEPGVLSLEDLFVKGFTYALVCDEGKGGIDIATIIYDLSKVTRVIGGSPCVGGGRAIETSLIDLHLDGVFLICVEMGKIESLRWLCMDSELFSYRPSRALIERAITRTDVGVVRSFLRDLLEEFDGLVVTGPGCCCVG